jgi:hypothetical protein
LERKAVLFLHPRLESLEIHHAYHDSDIHNPPDEASDIPSDYWRSPIFDADPGPKSTKLRLLQLYQSDINPQALTKILSFPQNLQGFTLTHRNLMRGDRYKNRQEADVFVEALKQQQESLESLNLQGLKACAGGIRLSMFSRLQNLDIGPELLFGWSGRSVRGPEAEFELENLLPPSLRQLTLRCHAFGYPTALRNLEVLANLVVEKPTMLPNLRRVHLIEERHLDESFYFRQECIDAISRYTSFVIGCLQLRGVDCEAEVRQLSPEPWSPSLQELMSALGNT